MQLCIFEDIYFDRLEPLIFSRPAYNLVCGISTLRDKITRAYPEVKVSLHTRPYLEAFLTSKNPGYQVNSIEDDTCLFINGRIIAPENLAEIIPLDDPEDKLYMAEDTIVAARVSGKKLKEVKNSLYDLLTPANFDGLLVEKVEIPVINYVWDLINYNHVEMEKDFNFLTKKINFKKKENLKGKIYPGAYLINEERIFIDEGAEIKSGAVLDATGGFIYISKDAIVYPNAVIEGPVFVGEKSQVKSCARIYENVSIGKVCKVGGEVEHSIILPYTNKQHSGFLGHAYLGSWVNIGADTNCSDLKNNYGSVKMYINGEIVNSGCQFLGLIMGDHCKTAINTMFNTGTMVGFSCNIYGADFPPKYIPSFSWGGSESMTTYDLERTIETAKRVLHRRSKVMSESEEKLFRKIFDLTQKERRKRGYPY
jgi:UDP-N-acetylglucosamine diphosphorylase/glucosamine-1-phosphate N-acetyltransferase